ncbi:MAG TPA: LpxD N-terminal domain-containing protein [Nitrososphaeraceae archaeon]|jgi:UDP-3-O-[3-hydroxymyristoyl] glucosamine N-acyltransferase
MRCIYKNTVELKALSSLPIKDIESILLDLQIDYQTRGSSENFRKVRNIAALDDAKSTDLTFSTLSAEADFSLISKSDAGIIICDKSHSANLRPRQNQLLVFVENPRLVFIHLINRSRRPQERKSSENPHLIHLSKSATLGVNCSIGSFSVIGDNCLIGNNAIIGNRVNLQNCVIGNNCIVQSGVSIGEDGFAYERNSSLDLEAFPHFGKVIIGNRVEIAVNCSIARGSLKDTMIGDGTKIDALVHIAHNVTVGRNCSLTAGAIVGGSTSIGDTCWLGLNSTLKHKIRVGNKVIIGSGASVIDDIADEDIVAGVPAKSIKHKVNSEQLFLMAGHTSRPKIPISDKRQQLHY